MQILIAVVLIALGVAIIVLRGRVAAFATWVRKDVLMASNPARPEAWNRGALMGFGFVFIALGVMYGARAFGLI